MLHFVFIILDCLFCIWGMYLAFEGAHLVFEILGCVLDIWGECIWIFGGVYLAAMVIDWVVDTEVDIVAGMEIDMVDDMPNWPETNL